MNRLKFADKRLDLFRQGQGAVSKSRLAILVSTDYPQSDLGEYGLVLLQKMVVAADPELLCVEISKLDWETRSFQSTPLEVRSVLIPLAEASDIVIVPVLNSSCFSSERPGIPGLPLRLTRLVARFYRLDQPRVLNRKFIESRVLQAFCSVRRVLTETTWSDVERTKWKRENQAVVRNTLDAVARDPGCRALLVVSSQRIHHIAPLFRSYSTEVEIVDHLDRPR